MIRSQAFRILCDLLSLDASHECRDRLLHTLTLSGLKWETLIVVANKYRVSPAISNALRRTKTLTLLPPDIVDYFDGIALLNRQRNSAIRAEAIAAARVLNGIGVTPHLLKGGANLLGGLYSDSADRFMMDLDILVPRESLTDCVASLRSRGYATADNAGVHPHLHHHHEPLARAESVASVELHVDPVEFRYNGYLKSKEIFDAAIVMNIDGVRIGIPSPTCRIVQSIVHAELTNHGVIYGTIALREMLDVALLSHAVSNSICWASIRRRFENRGAIACRFHLSAARDLLRAKVPDAVDIGRSPELHYRRALWLLDHPRLAHTIIKGLWLLLTLRLSLSYPQLRAGLLRGLGNFNWYRRQWNVLFRDRYE